MICHNLTKVSMYNKLAQIILSDIHLSSIVVPWQALTTMKVILVDQKLFVKM